MTKIVAATLIVASIVVVLAVAAFGQPISAYYLILKGCTPQCRWIDAPRTAPYDERWQCMGAGVKIVRDNPRWRGSDCEERKLER